MRQDILIRFIKLMLWDEMGQATSSRYIFLFFVQLLTRSSVPLSQKMSNLPSAGRASNESSLILHEYGYWQTPLDVHGGMGYIDPIWDVNKIGMFDRLVDNWSSSAKQSVLLIQYYGLIQPSQPNYIVPIKGECFELYHDGFVRILQNVLTLANLLNSKNISWGEYAEDLP